MDRQDWLSSTLANERLRARRFCVSAFAKKSGDILRYAGREVVARLRGDDDRIGIADECRSDSASAAAAIHRQDPQMLAARYRHAFEVAEDPHARRTFVAVAEAFLFRDFRGVVRRIVGASEKIPDRRQIRSRAVANHGVILAEAGIMS